MILFYLAFIFPYLNSKHNICFINLKLNNSDLGTYAYATLISHYNIKYFLIPGMRDIEKAYEMSVYSERPTSPWPSFILQLCRFSSLQGRSISTFSSLAAVRKPPIYSTWTFPKLKSATCSFPLLHLYWTHQDQGIGFGPDLTSQNQLIEQLRLR